ncbi:hypothetical protein IVB30_17620 [Bradyrhizobium sp. 200]|uniref:hypothetical protein n=1 Tax=Bradyrhizobium sp. 200 TaxID=2782665 RepID=UPI001FFE636E|nr:hypothetical protein [Bradyrhizobium sp. 200]UPJ52974.1 hypothetical protein IVB30_17620 [Bradyrhizobium sp. 200]
MRLKRLILPGRFVEAYVYFDFAWLFSKDGVVRAFDLARYCQERLNGEGSVAAALFSNNQLLSQHQRSDGQESSDLTQLLSSEKPIEVTAKDVDGYSYIFHTEGACRSVLDVRFYNGRAFVGADNGIRQFFALGRDDLQESKLGRSAAESLHDQRVSELPARQIRGRLGAVAAACGPAGGIVGFGAGTDDRDWRISFQPFTERCYGIELNGRAVSSLVNSTAIELYGVGRQEVQPRDARVLSDDEYDGLELTDVKGRGVGVQDAQLNQVITRLPGAVRTFLFKETFWVLAQDGFYYFRFIANGEITVPRRPTVKAPSTRVLSASGSAAGLIVESDDEVFLLNDHRWTNLVSEPVHSVRGYPSSKRYKRLITAVTRDRVELAAVLNSPKTAPAAQR